MENIKFNIMDQDDIVIEEQPTLQSPIQQQQPQQKQISVEEIIRNFIALHKPKVCILTPCFASLCYVNYVNCLLKTTEVFRSYNIPLRIEFCKNDSLVSRARNNLIARAIYDKEITHIIFIDNDIAWNPVDIIKLMLSNKPLVGGLYPIKKYHWDRIAKKEENVVKKWIDAKNKSFLKDIINDETIIQHNLLRYNINYLDNQLSIENNLCKVKHLATGFMMIHRETIEKMFKAFPSTKYTDDVGFLEGNENDYAYALFDCSVEYGHYLSEDWTFCERWNRMGGEIFVDVTINLVHTGIEDFNGNFLSSIV